MKQEQNLIKRKTIKILDRIRVREKADAVDVEVTCNGLLGRPHKKGEAGKEKILR